jgi:hypothetical protein
MKRVNHFGFLPSNPDNNLNSSVYGDGTDRPVGFTFSEIFKMYWTVRSFKCEIYGIADEDTFSKYLSSSQNSSNIALNTLAGLNSITSFNNSDDIYSGYTKITTKYIQNLRKGKRDLSQESSDLYSFEGIQSSKTQKEISSNYTKQLESNQSSVFEETLFSLGPTHFLKNSSSLNSGVLLDFSNIIYRKNLYWPKIQINSPNFTSEIKFSIRSAIGGVLFNGSLISMYYKGNNFLALPIINGSITIGQRCCDRFLYDSFDQERREQKECSGCEQIPEFKIT